MHKTILSLAAMTACLALDGAANAEDGAGRRGNPMQASAALASRAPVVVRYDSACRAKYAITSVGYQDCLQRLPATALVGGR